MKIRLTFFATPLCIGLAMVCLLMNCARASAQSAASAMVAGVLSDSSGRAVGGARIVATTKGAAQNAAPAAETQSHDDGSFTLALAPGSYHVMITKGSFTKIERDVDLTADQKVDWKLALDIAPLAASVIVTAQTQRVELSATTAPVMVVTHDEIEQREATSLPDLLATLPGFSLSRTGPEGGLATLFLDGGDSNHTKVLLDGAPLNDSGGIIDFSNFTLDNVDKIEIVHGAESALYGSDAMTGVIQIFTHRGESTTPEVDVEGDGGSFSTGRGSSTVSGILGQFDYSGGFSYLSTAGQGPNDFFFNRTMSGNFGYKFSKTHTLRVVLRNNTSDAGIPGQTLLIPPDLFQDNSLHDFVASVVWSFETGPHWHWQVTGTEADLRAVDTDTTPMFGFVAADQFNRAAGTAQTSYVLQNVSFTAGYMYEVENGFPSAIGPDVHVRRNNMAGFVDGRWQVTRRLALNAGGRVEDNASFGTHVVPRIGASYLLRKGGEIWGDTRLHAFYGQGIVEPELAQSFGTDPCFPGNPNLLPEESRTGSGGFDQTFASGMVQLSGDYFYNQLRNVISFGIPQNTPIPPSCESIGFGSFFNTNLARAYGSNISLKIRPRRWLTMSANYSYDNTLVIDAPLATDQAEMPGNRLLRRPLNSGSAVVNFGKGRFNANVLGYFTGARTDSAFLQFLGVDLTQMPNPGYARLDVTGSYQVQRHVTLFFRGQNILNRQYQDALGYPALGREILGGIKLRFGGE